ncbi:MAG: DUF86 domain-containing protein [Bacteroidia bacterium]|nr:DUF86 domain-containing protein [Bacteroidia bacterium]
MQFTLKEEVVEQLKLVLESISIIEQRNKDIDSVNDYLSSPWGMTILDATLMRIQFIGETLLAIDKKTNHSLFQNYPQIPWKQIFGMRNFISHQYADIDPEMILVTLRKYIPSLKSVIKQIIADLTSQKDESAYQ